MKASVLSKQPVEKVCHWLCQCCLLMVFIKSSALAKPVAHVDIGEFLVSKGTVKR